MKNNLESSSSSSSIRAAASSIDSRLFSSMQRVVSQIENDAVLVKSLQRLPYVRVGTVKDKRSGDRRKQKRTEELSLEVLSEELVKFLRIVVMETDLKAFLVLIKLLLCLWEETRDAGVEDFQLYMPVKDLVALERTRILGKHALLKTLSSLREAQYERSFLSAPRLLILKGRPSKIMNLEVRGEVVYGIIGGICVKPGANQIYYEATLKGSTFSGVNRVESMWR